MSFPLCGCFLGGGGRGSALRNEALLSPSSSFCFFSFHFPPTRNPPVAVTLSPLLSLSYLLRVFLDTSSGPVPITPLLLLSLSSHLDFHFPQGIGRRFQYFQEYPSHLQSQLAFPGAFSHCRHWVKEQGLPSDCCHLPATTSHLG